MKRSLSSFDIYVITNEMQQLIGYYIDKIYQPTRNELMIRIKNIKTKQKKNVFIRNSEMICLTQKQIEAPPTPTNFSMVLRKHLLNGSISEIKQHEFDRIIKLGISKKDTKYTLILELFSDGNIILVDSNEKIIAPLISQQWAHRTIKAHENYIPPPPQINPFNLTFEDFKETLVKSKADLVRTLAVNFNLSGSYAEEICARAGIDKKIKAKDADDKTIEELYNSIKEFLDNFVNKRFEPVIVKRDRKDVDILPFIFTTYKFYEFERVSTMVEGLERFIETEEESKRKENKAIDEEIKKLKRRVAQQEEIIKRLREEIGLKRLEGELIYLNFQELDSLLIDIKKVLSLKDKEKEIERINAKDIVKVFDPEKDLLIVNLKDTSGKILEIKINFRKTVSENAELVYEQIKKLKSKLSGAEKALNKTEDEIKNLLKGLKSEEKKLEKEEKKEEKLFWFEKFRWFISSDGNLVIGGKDAKSNEIVVKKYMKEGDRYVHADVHGAPSVIVKGRDINDKKLDISEKTLEEACIFAASFSKAWKQFAEAQAYWVYPEQVSKTPESGEFLPRGAFVIRGKRNYYKCKLELGVGVIDIEGKEKLMCAPVTAIDSISKRYVVILPGEIDKNEFAKRLSKVFGKSIDSIERILPPGGVCISRAVGVEI